MVHVRHLQVASAARRGWRWWAGVAPSAHGTSLQRRGLVPPPGAGRGPEESSSLGANTGTALSVTVGQSRERHDRGSGYEKDISGNGSLIIIVVDCPALETSRHDVTKGTSSLSDSAASQVLAPPPLRSFLCHSSQCGMSNISIAGASIG